MNRMSRSFVRVALVFACIALLGVPAALAQTTQNLANPAAGNWPTYGRDLQMQRFSPLSQINTHNVGNLRLSWSRSLSQAFVPEGSPVEYDGLMYVDSPDHVWALNATTGDVVWVHKVKLSNNAGGLTTTTKRGGVVVYDGNVYWTTGDGRLVALNAKTGNQAWSTQVGEIKYGEGFTSDPIFADGKIIVGPSGGDGGGVPGRVVALDATSGEVLWTFHTVPQPGQPNFNTWQPPTTAQWGGGSAWNSGAYDPVNNIVIYGVGNANPWYRPGSTSKDLYTGSWVALDAQTGKLKWYFQVAPHDEWDADQIPTPTVTNVTFNGQKHHVVLLPSVNGFLIVVDAATGKYLTSYKEMPKTTIVTGFQPNGTPILAPGAHYAKAGQSKLVCGMRWVDFEPAAYSPVTHLYYRPNTYSCAQITAEPLPSSWQPGQSAIGDSFQNVPNEFSRLGALSAIDPSTGKTVWSFTTKYAQYSGPVATASGLVFAGFEDRHFRAFDATNGNVLWQSVLPGGVQGNPITYEVNGVQYVAVLDGGSAAAVVEHQSSVPPMVTSDASVFVFALPSATQ